MTREPESADEAAPRIGEEQAANLTGTLRIEGVEPAAGLSLRLRSRSRGTPESEDEPTREVTTDANGRFEATVPSYWWGDLVLPVGWEFVYEDIPESVNPYDTEWIEGPTLDLVYSVRPVSFLTGLAVSPEQVPLPDLEVEVSLGSHWMGHSVRVRTDSEGRFFKSVNPAKLTSLSVTLGAAGPRTQRYQYRQSEVPADLDLGRLVLPHGRSIRFQVLDDAYHPLAGAICEVGQRATFESGADGWCHLEGVSVGSFQAQLTAAGFNPLCWTVPADVDEIEAMRMERSVELAIRLRYEDGRPFEKGRVFLGGAGPLFSADCGRNRGEPCVLEGELSGYGGRLGDDDMFSSMNGDPYESVYVRPARGRVLFCGLSTGRKWDFHVLPDAGEVLYSGEVPALCTGQRREIEVVVPAIRETAFRGRVLLPDGRPAEFVTVRLFFENGQEATAFLDDTGSFEISGILADRADLLLDSGRYAPIIRRGIALTSDPLPETFSLERARELVVEVKDESGKTITQNAFLRIPLVGSADRLPVEYAEPRARFTPLPAGEVTLLIGYRNQTFELRLDTALESVEVHLAGSAAVAIPRAD